MTHATTAKTTPNAIPISKPQNNITYVRDIPECSTAIMLMIVGVVKIVVEFVARKCLFDVRLNEIVVEILTLRGLDVGFGVTTLASEFPLNEVADVVEYCVALKVAFVEPIGDIAVVDASSGLLIIELLGELVVIVKAVVVTLIVIVDEAVV